ncbi:MAG: helix-turn-helix transcriptional regulator [Phycicoccus sp.]|nr:helix-turn-helix transcriptional regulator [Phycicoccus sp.]NMM33554.1 helix-turn-helix transcriptional regulator [Phycicoccus sp.]
MMAVFAHGQMRLYLLALLNEGPRHGYEIIQSLEERFNGLYSPSAGTVYPRLAKLEEERLVERIEDGRKGTYRITDAGRREVAAREFDLADLQQDLDHSVRELAQEVRQRVHGSTANLREELRAAAKEARATATPAGTSYEQQWPRTSRERTGSTTARDIEAAINAFRYEARDAARRISADDGARQEVLDILSEAARRIRNVLHNP